MRIWVTLIVGTCILAVAYICFLKLLPSTWFVLLEVPYGFGGGNIEIVEDPNLKLQVGKTYKVKVVNNSVQFPASWRTPGLFFRVVEVKYPNGSKIPNAHDPKSGGFGLLESISSYEDGVNKRYLKFGVKP